VKRPLEDACADTWAILLRRQPDRPTVAGWLYVTAHHELRAALGKRRGELRCDEEIEQHAPRHALAPEDHVPARDALRALGEARELHRTRWACSCCAAAPTARSRAAPGAAAPRSTATSPKAGATCAPGWAPWRPDCCSR
jgi:hypothetical protein